MTITTVMVCLALDQPNQSRLGVAGQLADRLGAGLVGIAAAQFAPPLYFTDGEFAQKLIDEGEAAVKARLGELEAQFREMVKARPGAVEWRSAVDFPGRFIAQEVRCADMIVTGGQSPAFSDAFALASPKDLVMQAGRPMLVVPDAVSWLDLRSVLVAWKDTPEARRAVADSIPLLRQAKGVTVTEILEQPDGRGAAQSRLRDVVGWLARHDIIASERVGEPKRAGGAAAALDEIAGDVGAGLIVAGAYGHARFRELILGGMTQHLLTQSARCVLLSH